MKERGQSPTEGGLQPSLGSVFVTGSPLLRHCSPASRDRPSHQPHPAQYLSDDSCDLEADDSCDLKERDDTVTMASPDTLASRRRARSCMSSPDENTDKMAADEGRHAMAQNQGAFPRDRRPEQPSLPPHGTGKGWSDSSTVLTLESGTQGVLSTRGGANDRPTNMDQSQTPAVEKVSTITTTPRKKTGKKRGGGRVGGGGGGGGGEGGGEEVEEAPDGGWGWVVCVTSVWVNGCVMGTVSTFGILYDVIVRQHPQDSQAALKTSFIGSCLLGVMLFMCCVSGILCDVIGLRQTAFTGGVLCVVGFTSSAYVTRLEFLYVTYGVILGSGFGLLYSPLVAISGHYFNRRLGLVNGLVTFGPSAFTVALSFALPALLPRFGLRHTLLGFAALGVTIAMATVTWKPLVKGEKSQVRDVNDESYPKTRYRRWVRYAVGKVYDHSLWRNTPFIIWCLAVAVGRFGYMEPAFHLVSHVSSTLSLPIHQTSVLVTMMSATSGLAKLAFGLLADCLRKYRIYLQQVALLAYGVILLLVPVVSNFWGFQVLAVCIGVADALVMVLYGPIVVDLVGAVRASQAFGFMALCSIPGFLSAPAITGRLHDQLGHYDAGFYLAGAVSILSAIIMIFVTQPCSRHSRDVSQPPSRLPHDTIQPASHHRNDVTRTYSRPSENIAQSCSRHSHDVIQSCSLRSEDVVQPCSRHFADITQPCSVLPDDVTLCRSANSDDVVLPCSRHSDDVTRPLSPHAPDNIQPCERHLADDTQLCTRHADVNNIGSKTSAETRTGDDTGRQTNIDVSEILRDGDVRCDNVRASRSPVHLTVVIGAEQLTPGTQQLTPGTQQLTPGTQQLTPGTQQLTPGTQQLTPGTQQLTPGAQQLTPGTQQLTPGTQQLERQDEKCCGNVQQNSPRTSTRL